MLKNKIINIYFSAATSTYISAFKKSHSIYHFIEYDENNIGSIIESINYEYQLHILVLEYSIVEKHNLTLSKLASHESVYSILMLKDCDNANATILEEDFIKIIIENDISYVSFKKYMKSSIEHLMKYHRLKYSRKDDYNIIALQEEEIFLAERRLNILYEVGIALSYEKDINKIINMILVKSKNITNSDAAAIWLLENSEDEKPHLRQKYSYNDSVAINSTEFSIPLDKTSISGYVASTGNYVILDDVQHLSGREGYVFNDEFDIAIGYKTISMMVVPLINNEEKVIGVLQLINRKNIKAVLPPNTDEYEKYIIDYDLEILNLIQAFASQATIALENALLYNILENSFEAFVNAVIGSIEARDPTTSGHSMRVMMYTVILALSIHEQTEGIYKDVYFDEGQMEELRYACLLHDIGKISIKENILMKAKKLHQNQIDEIERRIVKGKYVYANKILQQISEEDFKHDIEDIKEEYHSYIDLLNNVFQDIHKLNEPNTFDDAAPQKLTEIAKLYYESEDGNKEPILKDDEVYALKTSRGSLTEEERIIMNEHVVYSKNFLEKIPWTEHLKNITDIAAKHHEYLDGSGYPNGCKSDEISLQTRMMTIADIYDSLTASDRPYKKAVPMDISFRILREEAKAGKLDANLVEIFIKIFS